MTNATYGMYISPCYLRILSILEQLDQYLERYPVCVVSLGQLQPWRELCNMNGFLSSIRRETIEMQLKSDFKFPLNDSACGGLRYNQLIE